MFYCLTPATVAATYGPTVHKYNRLNYSILSYCTTVQIANVGRVTWMNYKLQHKNT